MLTRQHRFHGHNSLRNVYTKGQTARGQHLSLKYIKRPSGKPYRVSVVVSRKVNKSAVVRNRIRRRVYEAVRVYPEPIGPGTDLVFTAYSDQIAEQEASQLKEVVFNLLDRAIKS